MIQKLSFLAFAFLAILTAMNAYAATTPDARYANGGLMLSSVLDYMQYPLPASMAASKDNSLDFSKVKTGATDTPWKDEMRYALAYSFCQHISPVFPTPPHGTVVTSQAIQQTAENRDLVALRSGPMEECLAAISWRTACPKANSALSQSGTGGPDCYKSQNKACHYLKDTPPQGLGITTLSASASADEDHALADCDDAGLSTAMYEKIFAHRCDSEAYIQSLPKMFNGNSAMIEHAIQFECQTARDNFDAKLDRERERMLIAIQTLVSLRGSGAEANPTAGPAGSTGATP